MGAKIKLQLEETIPRREDGRWVGGALVLDAMTRENQLLFVTSHADAGAMTDPQLRRTSSLRADKVLCGEVRAQDEMTLGGQVPGAKNCVKKVLEERSLEDQGAGPSRRR